MMRRVFSYPVVARILGVLLLVAAALKVQGLGGDPVRRMGIFSTPEFQVAVVEFEVFLALWLLWGKYPLGSWLLALLTFGSFAAVSFYQGWVGQTSCGCFGRLAVRPWYTFGIDVAIIGTLLVGRPDLGPLWETPRAVLRAALVPTACGFGGIAVIGGLLLLLASSTFGSVPAAIAYFRGERVSLQPRLVEVGEGVTGEQRQVLVELANWTDQSIRLIGGTADCSCTVLNDLPVTIPAKETQVVSVNIMLKGKPGIFTRKAAFLVDDGSFRRISFTLTGRILKPNDLPVVTRGGS